MRPQFVSVAVWNSLSPSKTHARLQVLQSIGCSRTAGESVSTHQVVWKNAAKMGTYCGDLQGFFLFWEIFFAKCKFWIIHMIIPGFPIILGNIFFLCVLNGSLWLLRLPFPRLSYGFKQILAPLPVDRRSSMYWKPCENDVSFKRLNTSVHGFLRFHRNQWKCMIM